MRSLMLCVLSGIDPSLGRLDYASLSQQTLMEILVSDMSEENQEDFKDENGDYLDVKGWKGVELGEDSTVRGIDWADYDWTDAEPENQGRIRIEWLPDTVEEMNINNRGFEGELDCTKLPRKLRNFSAISNRLTGEIDLSGLPEGLVDFDIAENEFSGTISLERLPPTMNFLSVDGNNFIGTINLSSLPPTMQVLSLSKNNFSGEVNLGDLPDSMEFIYLNHNAFTGDINLKSLPEGMKELYLNDNAFDGKLIVGDLALEYLQIENNLLEKEIVFVGKCRKDFEAGLQETLMQQLGNE